MRWKISRWLTGESRKVGPWDTFPYALEKMAGEIFCAVDSDGDLKITITVEDGTAPPLKPYTEFMKDGDK